MQHHFLHALSPRAAVWFGMFAIAVWLISAPGHAQVAESVPVTAEQVLLNPEDPSQTRVGRLTYLGGVALTSRHPRFGGLSGLIVDGSGRHFLAISDKA